MHQRRSVVAGRSIRIKASGKSGDPPLDRHRPALKAFAIAEMLIDTEIQSGEPLPPVLRSRFIAPNTQAFGHTRRSVMLTASTIEKSFGGVSALRGVSIQLEIGEIVGLIGPNGSGKTTLLNIVAGVYGPEAGRVIIDGVDTTGWASHRIAARRVARTFQNIRLFANLTVLENVELAALVASTRSTTARAIARRHLDEMGLAADEDRRAATLPYGRQRRVEIARALAAMPRYLLLDEPAAGMNEAESDSLLQIISGLRDRYGFGILVIDHDLRLIMRLCERVVALNEGAIISEGVPHHIQTDPAVAEAYLGRRRHQISDNHNIANAAKREGT
jgi:branched-chain amino acid transport system permease protein